MKCVICKSPYIEYQTVEEELRQEQNIVLVPINLLVCQNCGERYYDRVSMQKLEKIKTQLQNNELNIKEVGKVMRVDAA